MKSLRRGGARQAKPQVPPLRSITRLIRCVESGDFSELPKSVDGDGLAWLAIGNMPSTCGSPNIVELLAKQEADKTAVVDIHEADKTAVVEADRTAVVEADKTAGVDKTVVVEADKSSLKTAVADKTAGVDKTAVVEAAVVAPKDSKDADKNAVEKPVEETPKRRKKRDAQLPRLQDFIGQVPGALPPVDPKDF